MTVDLRTVARVVPTEGHYVYWCWDHQDLMYVGASSRLADRLEKHAGSSGWWPFVNRVSFSNPFPTRSEAFEHERFVIAHECPLFNTKGL